MMADIDGDGQPELIAGKRYRGHSGDDPGSYDPLVVYYYKINRKTGEFTRYPISVNGTAGAGTQFIVEDLDGDGDIDIATAGKTGVHFFENLTHQQSVQGAARKRKSARPQLALPRRRFRSNPGRRAGPEEVRPPTRASRYPRGTILLVPRGYSQ